MISFIKKNRKLSLVIFLVILSVTIGISYYYFSSNKQNTDVSNNSTNNVEDPIIDSNNGNTANTNEDENNKNNSKYIKDKELGSYIWFSGNKWLLLSKNEGSISLITAEPVAILNYSYDNSNVYTYSYIRSWLNEKFYNTLNNKSLLKPNKYAWKVEEGVEKEVVSDFVGLITKENYVINQDFLNLGKYFWTMSATTYGITQVYYVNNLGNLDIGAVDSKYGVRPVISLDNIVTLKSGDGTKESPYMLAEETFANYGDKLNTRHFGEHVIYSDVMWRIVDINPDGSTKIAMNYVVWAEGFDTRNIAVFYPEDKENIAYYLNHTFYNNLSNRDWIKESVWYLKDYGYQPPVEDNTTKNRSRYNQYDLEYYKQKNMQPPVEVVRADRVKNESVTANVGLLGIGDFLTYDSFGYDWWLITQPLDSSNKLYFIYSLSGIISKADAFTNFPGRPVVNLVSDVYITSGDGTLENPYRLAR